MATKGVCLVNAVAPSTTVAGAFHAIISYAGLETGNTAAGTITLLDISPTIASTTLEANIKTEVKDYLIANHGYSFGLGDGVRLIGALL